MPGPFRQRAVVLFVEDNPGDVIMIREAFEQPLAPIQLHAISNGGLPGPALSFSISTPRAPDIAQ